MPDQDPSAETVAAAVAGDTGDNGAADTPEKAGGAGEAAWYSKYPQEARTNLAKYKDADAAILGLTEAAKLVGKSIQIPAADAPAEVWKDFYKKLGRPESKDGYDLKVKLSDGTEAPDGKSDWFREVSLEAGLRPEQARLIYQRSLEAATAAMKQRSEAQAKAIADGRAAVEAEAKKAGGDMATATKLVGRVVDRFVPEGDRQAYNKRVESDPTLFALMHAVGRAMSEDTLEGGGPGSKRAEPQQGLYFGNSPELYAKN